MAAVWVFLAIFFLSECFIWLNCESAVSGLYAASDYRRALESRGIACSMSRKGNCWDNAPMESFFSALKTELISRRTFATRKEAKSAIFEHIEVFYNRQRRHSALGYLSPVEYQQVMEKA